MCSVRDSVGFVKITKYCDEAVLTSIATGGCIVCKCDWNG